MNKKLKIFISLVIIKMNCFAQCNECNSDWGQFLESLPCEYNVNEPSWGNSFDDEKRSVFKISGWSGTSRKFGTAVLINQAVNQNQMHCYFLTSWHVIDGTTMSYPYRFYFNYQSKDDNNCSVPLSNQGCTENQADRDHPTGFQYYHESNISLVYHDADLDLALCEILTPIPPNFNVYYAGWIPKIAPVGTGVEFSAFYGDFINIHHPNADIKKISRTHFVDPVLEPVAQVVGVITTIIDWIACHIFGNCDYNTQYIVNYIEPRLYVAPWLNDGTVEDKSSGSPLFTRDRRILGTLHSGDGVVDCNDLNDHAEYTKFKNFYRIPTVKNALNPDGIVSVMENGIAGRQRTCYDDLYLQGNYFPLSDYQSENQLHLHANNNINVIGPLNIYAGSDYIFTAGGDINFGNNVDADLTAEVSAIPNSPDYCDPNSYRLIQDDHLTKLKAIVASLPNKKKFAIEEYKSVINIYPNPSNGLFSFSIWNETGFTLEIFSSLGELVYHNIGKSNAKYYQNFEVDLSHLPSGFYISKVTSTKGQVWTKTLSKIN